MLPPYMGMGLANYFSRKSREATGKHEEVFLGEENEWLITYCKGNAAEKTLRLPHFRPSSPAY